MNNSGEIILKFEAIGRRHRLHKEAPLFAKLNSTPLPVRLEGRVSVLGPRNVQKFVFIPTDMYRYTNYQRVVSMDYPIPDGFFLDPKSEDCWDFLRFQANLKRTYFFLKTISKCWSDEHV